MLLSTKKKGALVVDDSSFSRRQIKRVIDDIDAAEVLGEASDGDEAIELFKKLKPDLVTMDIVMPNKGGIEAIEAIIKIDKNAIIIVVSTMGQEEVMLEATAKGAKDFVRKPFKLDVLHDVLEQFLLTK